MEALLRRQVLKLSFEGGEELHVFLGLAGEFAQQLHLFGELLGH